MPDMDQHTEHQITYASERLKQAEEFGLVAEVMVYALKIMQERPNLFISTAIDEACKEWDV